jgi:fatty acid desaturase
MTVQERQTTATEWGQEWRQQRGTRQRGSATDFDTWRPLLLTPRMVTHRRNTGRSWFVFGGLGFMLFLIFIWAILFWVVLMIAVSWDFFVLCAYAATLVTVALWRKVKGRTA